ncbi:MAG: tetraacyldisaccharide 4'-kinase [Deltaproteobacteria bacterium]|nr:tetraacyldisaccharide 4'-kinase [Deltaproteobacteria bacterium]
MGRLAKRLNQIYNKLSQGDEKGFLYYSAFLPLYFFSLLYGIGVRVRFFLYLIGLFKTRKLDCKVISIGNITVGGSGKTPMAIFLAEKFREKGKKVVILSRGYNGKIKDIGVVSDGENILLGPEDAGDEPYLMAAKLKTIPVIVGRDRYTTGLYAIERFKPDVIILDDGFQHIRLYRDVDIVLIDLRKGFGNGHLFPLGTLREPFSGLKRGTFFLMKGIRPLFEKNASQLFISLIKGLAKARPNGAIEHCLGYFTYESKNICNLFDNDRLDVSILKNKRVIALSGIADPKSFKHTLEGLGASVIKEIALPDHYAYTHKDIQIIAREAEGVDMVITTMKDAVKLKSFSIEHLPIYALDIEVEIEGVEIFEKVAGLH